MLLRLDIGKPFADPSDEQLRSRLQKLNARAASFVILEASNQSFIQATVAAKSGYILEWRSPSDSEHRRCARSLPFQELANVFTEFLHGKSDLLKQLEWISLDDTENEQPIVRPNILSRRTLMLTAFVSGIAPFLLGTRPDLSTLVVAFLFVLIFMAVSGYVFLFRVHPWIVDQIHFRTHFRISYPANDSHHVWAVKTKNGQRSFLLQGIYNLLFILLLLLAITPLFFAYMLYALK